MYKSLILILSLVLTGCSHTFNGIGTDMQDSGIAIQNGVSDIQQTLNL